MADAHSEVPTPMGAMPPLNDGRVKTLTEFPQDAHFMEVESLAREVVHLRARLAAAEAEVERLRENEKRVIETAMKLVDGSDAAACGWDRRRSTLAKRIGTELLDTLTARAAGEG